jgi:hypothetical protein
MPVVYKVPIVTQDGTACGIRLDGPLELGRPKPGEPERYQALPRKTELEEAGVRVHHLPFEPANCTICRTSRQGSHQSATIGKRKDE